MVQRGQFLERSVVIRSGGFFLEGLWHRGEKAPALLICPPHPTFGSSMDSAVCTELAFAASQKGHATLRFNYRGAGASQGELSGLDACLEDARMALAQLRESVGGGEVALAGYDFGAQVAAQLAQSDEELHSLVAIAPLTDAFDFSVLMKLKLPTLIAAAQLDEKTNRMALSTLCQASGEPLVVIPEADHAFTRGLSLLGRTVARYLSGEPEPLD